MKKNKVLFGLVSLMCVGAAAGCGGDSGSSGGGGKNPKHEIITKVQNEEDGTVTGGGKYKNGETFTLKLYPVEGCHVNSPTVLFTKNGEQVVSKTYNTQASLDAKYFETEPITVSDGADGGEVTIGTYTTNFVCEKNNANDLANASLAKYDIQFEVFDKDGNAVTKKDADGNDVPITFTQTQVTDGSKLPDRSYLDDVEGKITWYKVNGFSELAKDADGNITTTAYDFNSSVKNEFKLIGVVGDSTAAGIAKDAITNFKNGKNYILDGSEGIATVLGLDTGLDKFYFGLSGKFLITKNIYYQIVENNNAVSHYKLQLNGSGFEVKDIKDVKDYLELHFLDLSGINDDDISLVLDTDNTTPVRANVELLTPIKNYNSTTNTFVIENVEYKVVDEEILDASDEVVGTFDDGAYLKFTKGDLKDKTYKLEDGMIHTIDNTVNCKIYRIMKNNKKYMDLYINSGYVYKTVRYDSKGNEEFVNIIRIREDDGWKGDVEPSVIYNMNLIKFDVLGDSNAELQAKLNKINTTFEDVMKNTPAEAKNLATLIEENSKLREVLREYDYRICSTNTNENCLNKDLVDTSKIFPTSSESSSKQLFVVVNAKYSDVDNALSKLKNGGFVIKTETSAFGESVEKSYSVINGVDIFKEASLNSLGVAQVVKNKFIKLATLKDDYYSFKYDATTRTYEFFENNGDSVPYITVMLTESGELESISYYVADSTTVNGRNTYTTTFDFETYKELNTSIESIFNGMYSVDNGTNVFIESNGDNMIYASEKPEGMEDAVYNMLIMLDDLLDINKFTMTVSDSTYTFVSKADSSVVYTITVDSGKIVVVTFGDETYTFNHEIEETLAVVDKLKSDTYWLKTDGLFAISEAREYSLMNEEYVSDNFGSNAAQKEKILILQAFVNNVGDYTASIVEDKYNFVKTDGTDTHTYIVEIIDDGEKIKITYTDGTETVVFEVDFATAKLNAGILNLLNGGYIVEKGTSNIYVSAYGEEKPVGISDEEWEILEGLIDLLGVATDETVLFAEGYEHSYNRSTKVHTLNNATDKITYEFVLTKANMGLGNEYYFVEQIKYTYDEEDTIEINLKLDNVLLYTILDVAMKSGDFIVEFIDQNDENNKFKLYATKEEVEEGDESDDEEVAPINNVVDSLFPTVNGNTWQEELETLEEPYKTMLSGLFGVNETDTMDDYDVTFDSESYTFTIVLDDGTDVYKWVYELDENNEQVLSYSINYGDVTSYDVTITYGSY